MFGWIFVSWGIGALVFLIMLIKRKFDDETLEKFLPVRIWNPMLSEILLKILAFVLFFGELWSVKVYFWKRKSSPKNLTPTAAAIVYSRQRAIKYFCRAHKTSDNKGYPTMRGFVFHWQFVLLKPALRVAPSVAKTVFLSTPNTLAVSRIPLPFILISLICSRTPLLHAL